MYLYFVVFVLCLLNTPPRSYITFRYFRIRKKKTILLHSVAYWQEKTRRYKKYIANRKNNCDVRGCSLCRHSGQKPAAQSGTIDINHKVCLYCLVKKLLESWAEIYIKKKQNEKSSECIFLRVFLCLDWREEEGSSWWDSKSVWRLEVVS